MTQTMRWYGPQDPISLPELRQAGITGIVTALHQIPVGEIWEVNDIRQRVDMIQKAGLEWKVIESLPVHEDIKRQTGNYQRYIDNYKQSLRNVAECGLEVVTYNFMPILDWLRTDHQFENEYGSKVLRYDPVKFAYFDLFLLKRDQAENDYSKEEIEEARQLGEKLSAEEKNTLFNNVLLGLPGSDENFTPEIIKEQLKAYDHIDDKKLRENLIYFLSEVAPVAEEVGLKLAIHPDDPPFSVLGLPRVVSTQEDIEQIFKGVDIPANGLCYCTGSLGARPENDLLEIFEKSKNRVHFLHLRNVKKETSGVFRESDHLDGDVPMAKVVERILNHMNDQKISLPMRPDHGYLHSADVHRKYYAGYSLIGRLKGLAELRGLELGLQQNLN
ncbi:mannonate dehydratase [Gramella sp. GC03-9]|uniref:Mannonate dehydratase n=2 Tax=Christiangramia oceanisediminis TaxID=2920386 RepID=A0A9X2I9B0_9FLAO|nr:mannonate dehydratase [Gramella oceanisediminis]MCP9199088.1 mannonate dehydratase [Gramella oceanisediminis]